MWYGHHYFHNVKYDIPSRVKQLSLLRILLRRLQVFRSQSPKGLNLFTNHWNSATQGLEGAWCLNFMLNMIWHFEINPQMFEGILVFTFFVKKSADIVWCGEINIIETGINDFELAQCLLLSLTSLLLTAMFLNVFKATYTTIGPILTHCHPFGTIVLTLGRYWLCVNICVLQSQVSYVERVNNNLQDTFTG